MFWGRPLKSILALFNGKKIQFKFYHLYSSNLTFIDKDFEEKYARQKSKNLSKSLSIIYGLQTSLDFDKALEIANNLFQLYEYCRHEIIKGFSQKIEDGIIKAIDVIKQIIKYIGDKGEASGIVYCLSRKKVEEIAELLILNNIKSVPYHAGLDTKVRNQNQDAFLMEDVDVVVATIAFGMGIDKPDIRFVIHYDIAKSLEGYYQETGRAGRDGGEGHCLTFYCKEDIKKLFFNDNK